MTKENIIRQAYEAAAERYAAVGVDAREAMDKLQKISLSMHCWQADDVSGFENQGGSLTGGIQVTGNYPGRARTIDEVRADVLKAASLIAGKHRLNLHENYMATSKARRSTVTKWNLLILRAGCSGRKRTG